jgi:hypothetical protein
MMSVLRARAERLARAGALKCARETADRIGSAVGDASLKVAGSTVIVSGRNLLARWLADPALRFLRSGA